MSDEEVYQGLIDWLRQHWIPLPDADELIPLMKAAVTPEEASLLTGIPISDTNLEKLAEVKQMDPAELRQRLDAIAKKGSLFRTVEGDTIRYRLPDGRTLSSRFPFWPGRTDERTKALSPLANQYYDYIWDVNKYTTIHHKGLRALPIEGTIEDTRQILPYEEVAKVLDTKDYFCVTTCPCRHKKNMDPDSPTCQYSTQNCLHFDRLAHYVVENDLGREITREEAHEILRQSAEEGLVHGLGNMQEGGDTLCNCCQCCCLFFMAVYKLGHAAGMSPSNYRARPNTELCIGDGLCVKRCPMEAIHLEDSPDAKNRVTTITDETGKETELKNKTGKVAVINTEICIGCGVCAYKCSTKSLVLERCEVIVDPSINAGEFAKLTTAEIEKGQAHLRKSI